MPKQLELTVGHDHVARFAHCRNPIVGVEELIWNSLDADATQVNVGVFVAESGALSRITVADNGHGIPYIACAADFGSLGSSQKSQLKTTPGGRQYHGRYGQGRFRALGLGRSVTWTSTYKAKTHRRFSIKILRSTLRNVQIGDEEEATGPTGVVVTIEDFESNFGTLTNSAGAAFELARRLAIYLRQYPGINVVYDGHKVDPNQYVEHQDTYKIDLTDANGLSHASELTVIEWSRAFDRKLYLCTSRGFALDEYQPGIHAPGFHFTAYLKSDLVEALSQDNALALNELHPTVKVLLDAAKDTLRDHFRRREAERAVDHVKAWTDEAVYPYAGHPNSPLEKAEREVFDACALTVNSYLPGFQEAKPEQKRLTFRLIREALERSPGGLHTILHEVLTLPPELQKELADLLRRTRLSALLAAAKTVVDRLDFIQSLYYMLFGELRETLKERKHLHRILAQETWIFGEQYAIGVDDQGLKALLQRHIALLGRDELAPDPVVDLEGKSRVVDLMLYTRLAHAQDRFEHLVVELKRPSVALGQAELSQIQSYAFAVAEDPRFDKAQTKWTFVLLGNELDAYAERMCRQQGRQFGHIVASDDGAIQVHVKKWSTVITEATWRYEFFRERLALQATEEDGAAYVRSKYPHLLPPEVPVEPVSPASVCSLVETATMDSPSRAPDPGTEGERA